MINLILVILFYYINIDIDLKTKLIYTNILIGVLNLIPILPLDGGKILREILKGVVGNKRANILMSILTKTILILLSFAYSIAILYVKSIPILLILIYLWYLYYMENKKLKLMMKAYDVVEKERGLKINN